MTNAEMGIGPYPDKGGVGDAAHEAHKLALQAADVFLPMAGTIASKVIEHFVGSPLQARRDEWFKKVGERLDDLLTRGLLSTSDLEGNEEFVSVVAEATSLALRTHHEAKREALCNAVLNTAKGHVLDDVLRDTFMRHIGEFSGAHIRLLRVMSDPSASPVMVAMNSGGFMGSIRHVLREEIPDTEMPDDVLNRVVADLNSAGMMDGSLGGLQSPGSYLQKKTTQIGDAFLRFVSEPT